MPSSRPEFAGEASRIVLAVGGTAGHFYPAIAVREAWTATAPSTRFLLAGTNRGIEENLARRLGLPIEILPGAPFMRESAAGKMNSLLAALAGVRVARRWLRREGAELVIGFGGFATVGVLVAARTLGIATALHEANVVPGLANRWLGKIVDRVFVSWPQTTGFFEASKTRVTGTPVRREFLEVGSRRSSRAPRAGTHVLVSGGSLGSRFLNERAPELIGAVRRAGALVRVLHQSGEAVDPRPIHAAYRSLGIPARVESYVEAMSRAYAWADYAITGAGAVTLAEIASARVPTLVVPLSTCSGRHQDANAEAFAQTTGARWVAEEAWDQRSLASHLVAGLAPDATEGGGRICPTRDAAAAEAIASECRGLLGPSRRGSRFVEPMPNRTFSRASARSK